MYYESFFDLTRPPFSISPDPSYLYLTPQHREALAHLIYGVNSQGGFVLLTGEVGAGKTTLCQCLLAQLPEQTDIAYILNPKLGPVEFFATLCDELGIEYEKNNTGLKYYLDLISRHLLANHAAGRNTVLMIDEAQGLDGELLEHLRLLTNLETHEKKLLQILLVGQPELRDMLARPELKQMSQRITARFHLGAMSRDEIRGYVEHRLKIAGARRELFDGVAIRKAWQHSGGVPRLVNIICDRALMGAAVSRRALVDGDILDCAAAEVFGSGSGQRENGRRATIVAGLAMAVAVITFAAVYYWKSQAPEWVPLTLDVSAADSAGGSPAESAAVAPEPEPTMMHTVSSRPPLSPGDETDLRVPVALRVEQMMPDLTEPSSVGEAALAEASAAELIWPASADRDSYLPLALAGLLKLWGIEASPHSVDALCELAGANGIGCLAGQANLPRLAVFNHPAMVTLYDDLGRSRPALLRRLAPEGEVELVLAGEPQWVSPSVLADYWYGEYLLLWQTPPDYQGYLALGAKGPMVGWLNRRLGLASAESDFTAALDEQVRLFQQTQGLVPDGIVGPQTVMALNNIDPVVGPKLTVEP